MKKLICHCGQFKAEINVDNLDKVLRCNCSICKRKGAIMSLVRNNDFKIVKGEDKLTLYPSMTGFNLGCVESIDTLELKDVQINDGKNHPLDKN